jgi:hypothetical protein
MAAPTALVNRAKNCSSLFAGSLSAWRSWRVICDRKELTISQVHSFHLCPIEWTRAAPSKNR